MRRSWTLAAVFGAVALALSLIWTLPASSSFRPLSQRNLCSQMLSGALAPGSAVNCPGVVTILYCNAVGNSGGSTVYTFTAVSLAACPIASSRQLVVATDAVNNTAGSGFAVSGITVGGVSAARDVAKIIVASGSANTSVELWRLADSTNTAPNIAVTWAGAQLRSGIGVYGIYGANTGAASATASGDNANCSCATAVTASLAVPVNGVAIIATEGVSSPTAFTFTSSGAANPTKDYDATIGSQRAGAHTSTAGTQTFSVTPNASTFQSAVAMAAYGK